MNIIVHFLINVIIAFILRMNLTEVLLVGLGGIIVDIDHLLYVIFKKISIKDAIKYGLKEFKLKRPHVYIFHFIEPVLVISYFINWYFFLLIFGVLLHIFADVISYVVFYKSLPPWIKYMSLLYRK